MTVPAWAASAERITATDVSDVKAALASEGAALVPAGTGSRLSRGIPPASPVRLLDLSVMDGIVEYEPEDMTVTARVGTRWRELQQTLGEKGQWLPVDPLSPGTVGGLIAADRRCPLAGGYGSIRDYCIGIRFVDGQGREVRAGGRVVKNVAGYDLMKLQIGSLGELGVVTEATFKVLPRPEVTRGIRIVDPDREILRAARTDLARAWFPSGLWCLDRGSGAELTAVFSGSAVRVEAQVRGFRNACSGRAELLEEPEVQELLEEQSRWREERDAILGWGGSLPTFLADHAPDGFFPTSPWTVDLLRGHFWCRLADAARLTEMRAILGGESGHLHVDGNGSTDSTWGSDPDHEADLWRKLKETLDPKGRLPRGRLPGGV